MTLGDVVVFGVDRVVAVVFEVVVVFVGVVDRDIGVIAVVGVVVIFEIINKIKDTSENIETDNDISDLISYNL